MKIINSFYECNPNPIIEISKHDKSVVYTNLAARVQFPSIEVDGINHIIFKDAEKQIDSISHTQGKVSLMISEVIYNNNIFEQQIFSAQDENGIFVYMSDITYYKRIEKISALHLENYQELDRKYKNELQEARNELKISSSIFDNNRQQMECALKAADVATWNWHIPCDIVTWDNNLNDLIGIESDKKVSSFDKILSIIHPDDRQLVSSELKYSWKNKTRLMAKFRIITTNNMTHHLTLKGKSYTDKHGQPMGLAGICLHDLGEL